MTRNVAPESRAEGPFDRYKASSYRAYNDKLPERYDTSIAVRLFRVSAMDDFVLGQLGPDLGALAILDVGCATGRLLDRLASAGARQLAGSDLAPRILEVARAKLARRGVDIDLRAADAETSLPWPSGTFDVVTLTGVLHHFVHPLMALGEVSRVLRLGGRLIVSDACFFPPLREFLNLCLRVHPHEGDHRFFALDETGELLRSGGWDVIVLRRLSWWSCGVVGVLPQRGES